MIFIWRERVCVCVCMREMELPIHTCLQAALAYYHTTDSTYRASTGHDPSENTTHAHIRTYTERASIRCDCCTIILLYSSYSSSGILKEKKKITMRLLSEQTRRNRSVVWHGHIKLGVALVHCRSNKLSL
ncbi:hypothetical protein B0O99DRAFT_627132 [Bisporella sp. PMI_857]|nr:hypothetical protein B0O99DRAFT_627132 [Bisporella sp. PMI_857]